MATPHRERIIAFTQAQGSAEYWSISMFSSLDWAIVAAYLIGTTWVEHALEAASHELRFFLGGRNVPWPAVAASSIATTISAITFVSVPALVYAADGISPTSACDRRHHQPTDRCVRFGSSLFFGDYYSPYDFTRHRLGPRAGRLISGLFLLGGVLGQVFESMQPLWCSNS